MNWLLIALIAPFLWSLANHTDKYLLSRHFSKKSGEGAAGLMMFMGLGALVTLPFIYFGVNPALFVNPWSIVFLMISGALINIAIFTYLRLLSEKEASYIIPFWQLAPIFAYLLGLVLLKEQLSPDNIIGSLIAICGAIILSLELEEGRLRVDIHTLAWMTLSSLCIASSNVFFKMFAIDIPFWTSVFWNQAGMVVFGSLFLLVQPYRREFFGIFRSGRKSREVLAINVFQQIIETGGVVISNYALLLAPVALITLVEYTFQPVFVFFEGLLLTMFLPHITHESMVGRHLIQKFISIIIMCIGLYMISN